MSDKISDKEKKEKMLPLLDSQKEKEANALIIFSDSLINNQEKFPELREYFKLIKAVGLRKNKNSNEAIAVLKTINFGEDKDLKYYSEYHLARTYMYLSDYNNALGYLLNNLDYFREYKKQDKQQVIVLGSISGCYRRMKMFDKALEYSEKAIELSERTGDTLNKFDAYSALALCYLENNRMKSADSVFEWLEPITVNLSIKARMSFFNNYAETSINLDKLEKGSIYIKKCYDLACLSRDTFWIGIALVNMGNIRNKNGEYRKADHDCHVALGYFEKIGSLVWQKNACTCIYESNMGLKDYKKAIDYYKKFVRINDSILSEKNSREMTRKEIQFEFDKKEAEVKAAAKAEREKAELKAAEDKKRADIIIFSVITGLLLVSVFSFFIYRSLRLNKHANKIITAQKQLVEEKQKEILDSIHYAKKIQQSLMPTEKYIEKNVSKLKSGKT